MLFVTTLTLSTTKVFCQSSFFGTSSLVRISVVPSFFSKVAQPDSKEEFMN